MKYTLGWVRNKHDDLWQARFSYQEDGRRKEVARNFRCKADGPEDKAVQKKVAEIRSRLEAQAQLDELYPTVTPKDMTMADYMDEYIRLREESQAIEKTTIANYRASAKYVKRYMGATKIADIRPSDVTHMDKMLLGDELKPDTVSKAHRFAKQVLDYAVENGHLAKNPITRSVKPPKREQHEPNSLDDETRRRLLTLLDGMPDGQLTLAIRLGLSCGLRNEEALGLKWGDVDLKNGTLQVRNCVTMANGKIVVKGPKTAAGKRKDVPIDPDLVGRLARRRESVREFVGADKVADLYVLGDASGRFYHPTFLSKEFATLAKTNGINGTTGRRATFYSLRHCYATTMLRHGADAKTVSALMGHSSVAETLNIYASTDRAAKEQAGRICAQAMAER